MIDFTAIFGKRRIEPLRFSTRRNVNYFHEVIFLSSYLHDSTFAPAELTYKDGVLVVPVQRTCWEFWTRLRRVREELLGCRSLLTVSGVRSMKWNRTRLPKTVEIAGVFVGEGQCRPSGRAHLVLYSYDHRVRLELRGKDTFFDIELKDLEEPR
jgi:hypothetical protein